MQRLGKIGKAETFENCIETFENSIETFENIRKFWKHALREILDPR